MKPKSKLLVVALALLPHLNCNQPNFNITPYPKISNLETRLTEANQILRDFPNSIPGAVKISKHPTPDAKYCLVHIRQVHHLNSTNFKKLFKKEGITDPKEIRDRLTETYYYINEVQENIYHILNFLANNGISNEVYAEGITQEPVEGSLAVIYTTHRKDIANILWNIKELDFRYVTGAEILLGLEKVIKVKPAETFELNIAALKATTYEELRDLHEKREDIVLELVSKQENPLAVMVYGGRHAWGGKKSSSVYYFLNDRKSSRDNIAEWNKNNPNEKFSLIEILPKGY